jgi:demethylmenaquinone methyltransferase/2-methoxy-6-polyprenyl-1,4-benzoquinol methylase
MTSDSYIHRAIETNPLREPLLRSVIQQLKLPLGSIGLDAGCGIGLQTILLAEAVGGEGRIIGLDRSRSFLSYAEHLVERHGLKNQISFQAGDLGKPPFASDSLDWVWSADCIGYPAAELLPQLRALWRVVRSGGLVAILAWTSQKFLPGYMLLEARLNADSSGYAQHLSGVKPEAHFMRALHSFKEAGFENAAARSFLSDIQGPLSAERKKALTSLAEMLWGTQSPQVTPGDWEAYKRLCRPESNECILNLPDYYGFFTYTLFSGTVAK